MRINAFVFYIVLAAASMCIGAQSASAQGETPIGFSVNIIDDAVSPCTDFYKYACGKWFPLNPIPSDRPRWSRFDEINERNVNLLHSMLDDATSKTNRSDLETRIGDFYASCMDESTIDSLGAKPLEPRLALINGMRSKKDLTRVLAEMHITGGSSVFGFGPAPDQDDATMWLPNLSEGRLGLPDRDYYLKQDARSVETRAKYEDYIRKILVLTGETPERAAAAAKNIIALETELAKPQKDVVARRDARNFIHKMTLEEASRLFPNVNFKKYLRLLDAPSFKILNVTNPDYIKVVNQQVSAVPLETWKEYLRFRVGSDSAPSLSSAFVNEWFEFNGRYMNGQKALAPRWKRCTRSTDAALGELLGQLFVASAFGPEAKQRTVSMMQHIEKAMSANIDQLDWMTEDTKKQARAKLSTVVNNVGYPDKWRDYSSVKIAPNDYYGNAFRVAVFESRRALKFIGTKIDRTEWSMTPPTVNAYYRPTRNDINFPAGILQPPFFEASVDDAVNYGAIGAIIGHELTHGYDDSGSRFDLNGNLKNWWSEQDRKEFEQRADCFVQQYGDFTAVEDLHVNGKLTLGENIADNGGARLSLMALREKLGDAGMAEKKDGFTAEQRFFLGYAQSRCANATNEFFRKQTLTDPHTVDPLRVNGVVQNMPEFSKAFACKQGDAMVRAIVCKVW